MVSRILLKERFIKNPLKAFSKLKLKYKLFMLCLFLVFLPIVILGAILISRITDGILEQKISDSKNSVYLINENLKNYIKIAEEISDSIYINNTIRRELGRNNEATPDLMRLYNDTIYPVTIQKRYIYRFLHAIRIYMDNEYLIYNGDELIYATEDIKKEKWYTNAIEKKGTKQWDQAVTIEGSGNSETRIISLTRSLLSMDNSILGVLQISIKEEYLHNLLERESDGRKQYIINNFGNIISSTDESMIGKDAQAIGYLSGVFKEQSGVYDAAPDGEKSKVIFNTCITTSSYINRNWKVVSVVPVGSLLKDVNEARNFGILICLLVLFVMIFFIFIFSTRITIRLKRLVENTHEVSKGNFNEMVEVSGGDEIAELGESFNKMVANLNELVNEVYESKIKMQSYQLKKREAELNALQSQINPHFLYNSLDAIRMHAVIGENEPLAEMLMSLSSLLRYSISRGREIVTVQDEINHAIHYIDIINMKYDKKIALLISIPENMMKVKILKLVIQPIVENAFQHGIKGKMKEGIIEITGQESEQEFLIEVTDNGEGMLEDKLVALNKEMGEIEKEEGSSGSIGLSNVNSRIKLYFGMEYGLEISSRLGEGTTVKIRLPWKEDA